MQFVFINQASYLGIFLTNGEPHSQPVRLAGALAYRNYGQFDHRTKIDKNVVKADALMMNVIPISVKMIL
jgi:hypothetical protein